MVHQPEELPFAFAWTNETKVISAINRKKIFATRASDDARHGNNAGNVTRKTYLNRKCHARDRKSVSLVEKGEKIFTGEIRRQEALC